ncbi:hypothetical protein Dimus_032170 [Dionaea muscipula]
MATGKPAAKEKPSSTSKRKRLPLGPRRAKIMKNEPSKPSRHGDIDDNGDVALSIPVSSSFSSSEHLSFFLDQFQSANGIKLSSLELDSFKDTCVVELCKGLDQDASNLGKHMKYAFGTSWKEVLSDGKLVEGMIDPGSPAVLVISSSAVRSLELIRGLRSVTKECPAVKLFSKHIKVEDQVSLLKNRVNIASGTPSRIKKLCEMEALGLSRLMVLVLDMQTDAKGYSLFTLPQVRDEFWDLYKNYLHRRLFQGEMRVCLYGPIPSTSHTGNKKPE